MDKVASNLKQKPKQTRDNAQKMVHPYFKRDDRNQEQGQTEDANKNEKTNLSGY